jgi:hypothetical protein
LVVGARTFPGNPYDGHTLAPQIEQTTKLLEKIGVTPTTPSSTVQPCKPLIHKESTKRSFHYNATVEAGSASS